MPNLPTFPINDSTTWNRLLAAFNNNSDEYKQWLKGALAREVLRREVGTTESSKTSEITVMLDAELPNP